MNEHCEPCTEVTLRAFESARWKRQHACVVARLAALNAEPESAQAGGADSSRMLRLFDALSSGRALNLEPTDREALRAEVQGWIAAELGRDARKLEKAIDTGGPTAVSPSLLEAPDPRRALIVAEVQHIADNARVYLERLLDSSADASDPPQSAPPARGGTALGELRRAGRWLLRLVREFDDAPGDHADSSRRFERFWFDAIEAAMTDVAISRVDERVRMTRFTAAIEQTSRALVGLSFD